jgi:hypothetical protein
MIVAIPGLLGPFPLTMALRRWVFASWSNAGLGSRDECAERCSSVFGAEVYRDRAEVPYPTSSLSAFEPLVQRRLSGSSHHLPYALFLHHTFITHEFFHRSRSNWSHAEEDFGSNQMLKGLQMAAASGQIVLAMNVQSSRLPSSKPPCCNASCQYYHHQLEREPIETFGLVSERSHATSQM